MGDSAIICTCVLRGNFSNSPSHAIYTVHVSYLLCSNSDCLFSAVLNTGFAYELDASSDSGHFPSRPPRGESWDSGHFITPLTRAPHDQPMTVLRGMILQFFLGGVLAKEWEKITKRKTWLPSPTPPHYLNQWHHLSNRPGLVPRYLFHYRPTNAYLLPHRVEPGNYIFLSFWPQVN
jgi:hypothetical protein